MVDVAFRARERASRNFVARRARCDKRFAEVANQRKQIEAALNQLKTDPAKALKEIAGLDLDEWAEKRILERYQEAMLPEAEREKAEMQRKLADYERQFEEQKTTAERQKAEAYEQQVVAGMVDAPERYSGLGRAALVASRARSCSVKSGSRRCGPSC